MGFEVLGFPVFEFLLFGFLVWGLGFKVSGSGFRVTYPDTVALEASIGFGGYLTLRIS